MRKGLALSALWLSSCVLHRERIMQSTVTQETCTIVEQPWMPMEVQQIEQAKPLVVLVVGDSEACAAGGVANEVSMRRSVTIYTECMTGSRVQYWSTGRLDAALDQRPDVTSVIVFLGGNHVGDKSVPDVTRVLTTLKQRHVGCIWAGNARIHGKTWSVNAQLNEAVSGTCRYLDLELLDVKLPDGMHPNAVGARVWLDAALDLLEKKS